VKKFEWIISDIFLTILLIIGKLFNMYTLFGVIADIVLVFYILCNLLLIIACAIDEDTKNKFSKNYSGKSTIKKVFIIIGNAIYQIALSILYYYLGYKYPASFKLILLLITFILLTQIITFSNDNKATNKNTEIK